MPDYTKETVSIPVTRWKSGRHGIKPKTEPMSKLVSSLPASAPNIPAIDAKAGYKTGPFKIALPPMPKGKGKEHAIEWMLYADAMTGVWAGNTSYKVSEVSIEAKLPEPVIVPRGTFIGPPEGHSFPEPTPFIGPMKQVSKSKAHWIPRNGVRVKA